jgi:protein SCO1/2
MPYKLIFTKVLILVAGLAIVTTGCVSSQPYAGTLLDPPKQLPAVELMDSNGQPFQLNGLKDSLTLVYFGYTHCPDVCPLTMWRVKQALAELDEKERVRVLFISVDPERDTAEVLARYVHRLGPEFIGLNGDREKIKEVIKPFGAMTEKEETIGSDHLVNHTPYLYLVNPHNQLLLIYPHNFKPEALRADLEQLLKSS